MPEPFSTDHLHQLRQRWERDPKSRAFLQLAEEYRRAGRLGDAVHVLRAGLEEHPTYLAAQVALGRCLMESGDPEAAVELLERAVARDPTQLVANKLLVETYLARGQAGKARERLDLYKLFNDRDAEIEPLENRIRALEGQLPASVPAKSRPGAPPIAAGELFDLPAPASLPGVDLAPLTPPRRPHAAVRPAEPFGPIHASDAVQRIESALARQGIFTLASPAAVVSEAPAASAEPILSAAELATETARGSRTAEPVASRIPAPEDGSLDWQEDASSRAAASRVGNPPLAGGNEESETDTGYVAAFAEPEPVAPVLPISVAPKAASTTLGELYLAQGHLTEAEESFQAVLQARPGDPAALAGLESVRQQRGEEAAAFADEMTPPADAPSLIIGGLTARKAELLRDYLARIRRGSQRHVS